MKKLTVILLVLTMVLSMAACGAAGSSAKTEAEATELGEYTVRISHGLAEAHPVHMACVQMKEYVEKESGGKLTVEIYPNSQIGGERESVEAVLNGTCEMAYTTNGPLTSFAPEFMVMDIPFQFDSYEEAWLALDSNVGKTLADTLKNHNLYLMCWMESGFRHLTTSGDPVTTPEDLQGRKIRTMEAAMHMTNFKALGANPTPVSWTELYLAMSQKLVDGQENPLGNIVDQKMWEVQANISLTGHIYDEAPLVTNYEWFSGLPAEYQLILKDGAAIAQNYSRFMNFLQEEQYRQLCEDKGMEIIDLSAEQKEAFREIGQPAVVEAVVAEIGSEFVDWWLKAVDDLKAQELVDVVA